MQKYVLKKAKSFGQNILPIGDAELIIKDLLVVSELNRKTNRQLISRDNSSFTLKYRDSEKYGDNSYSMAKPPTVISDIVNFCIKKTEELEKSNYMVTFISSGPKANISIAKPLSSVVNRFIFNFCYNEIYELKRDSMTSETAKTFTKCAGDDPLAEICTYIPANSYLTFSSGIFADYTVTVEANHRKTYPSPSNPFSELSFKRFPGYKMCVVVDVLDTSNETETKTNALLREIGELSKEDIKDMGNEYKTEHPIKKVEKKQQEKEISKLMGE